MKGLIIKDLLLLKNQAKTLLFILVFFVVFSVVTKDFTMLTFMMPFCLMMLIISTFSYDEFNHWDIFCNTMPYKKSTVVMAKYVLLLLGIGLTLLYGIGFSCISSLMNSNILVEESISDVVGGITGVLLVLSLMTPFFYKYGVQKGKIALLSVIICILIIVTIIPKILPININFNFMINFLDKLNIFAICLILVLCSFIVLSISYQISKRIYLKKEF